MILDEFIELWQALLQYFYDYEKYVEIDQNRPRRLQNEALRPPKAPRVGHFELVGALLDALGDPRALWGCSRGLQRPPGDTPAALEEDSP